MALEYIEAFNRSSVSLFRSIMLLEFGLKDFSLSVIKYGFFILFVLFFGMFLS